MADTTQITYSYKELVALMVKDQGIREGIWGLVTRFGLKATNLGTSDTDLVPSAIVGVIHIGIQRMDKPTNLTVDAAEVSRATSSKQGRSAREKGQKKTG
jgi:hypothetical protein